MEEDNVFTKRFIDCVKKPHQERTEEVYNVSVSRQQCVLYGFDVFSVCGGMCVEMWPAEGVAIFLILDSSPK